MQNKASLFVRTFVSEVENLLAGSIAGDPDKTGETLADEKRKSGTSEWPDFTINFSIQNSKLKVYGGAQYSRLLNEFEYMAHSREFPKTTPSEIASALGTSKSGFDMPVFETAVKRNNIVFPFANSENGLSKAANLVQVKAKQVFLPLIDILLKRCSYIMKRLFGIGVEVLKFDPDQKGIGVLTVYEKFMQELKNTFFSYIDQIEKDCEARLKDDFVMFTKIVDWNSMCVNPTEQE